jgi:hypothetical protein
MPVMWVILLGTSAAGFLMGIGRWTADPQKSIKEEAVELHAWGFGTSSFNNLVRWPTDKKPEASLLYILSPAVSLWILLTQPWAFAQWRMLMVVSAKVQSGRLKEHLVPSLWARRAFEMIDANFYIYHIHSIYQQWFANCHQMICQFLAAKLCYRWPTGHGKLPRSRRWLRRMGRIAGRPSFFLKRIRYLQGGAPIP